MGTDNLFHKRKAQKLQRNKPSRKPYEKVLIVCEGRKTEPNYFNELKDFYEIDTANIHISGDCGSDPISVVRHGEDLFKEAAKTSEPFDKVFCVFDRDNFGEKFHDAIRLIDSLKPKNTYKAITSTPCFEIWLILHYTYISTSIETVGKKSCGARTLEELHKYWPEYNKGHQGVFEHLFNQLDSAKSLSARLINDSKNTGSTNPLTLVHELVEYLQNVKT
ncbi:RloB family protein [Pseudomonas sp. COR58]|uniref:RloB family protein n=1 Tax=Pseudomonas ekonensis TaxID=2842353 RepID=A0ABS6PG07_9PSED|nr:RloB family protein [Pseudomonas ekonensis]MBV4459410.1 RloB family protein [Pseudomonas ekonensis]